MKEETNLNSKDELVLFHINSFYLVRLSLPDLHLLAQYYATTHVDGRLSFFAPADIAAQFFLKGVAILD